MMITGIGLYGTLTHEVASHTRELGIRMALGADAWRITKATLASVTAIVAGGVALGVPVSLASGRVIESLLYNVSGVDPIAVTVAVVCLAHRR